MTRHRRLRDLAQNFQSPSPGSDVDRPTAGYVEYWACQPLQNLLDVIAYPDSELPLRVHAVQFALMPLQSQLTLRCLIAPTQSLDDWQFSFHTLPAVLVGLGVAPDVDSTLQLGVRAILERLDTRPFDAARMNATVAAIQEERDGLQVERNDLQVSRNNLQADRDSIHEELRLHEINAELLNRAGTGCPFPGIPVLAEQLDTEPGTISALLEITRVLTRWARRIDVIAKSLPDKQARLFERLADALPWGEVCTSPVTFTCLVEADQLDVNPLWPDDRWPSLEGKWDAARHLIKELRRSLKALGGVVTLHTQRDGFDWCVYLRFAESDEACSQV